MTKIETTPNVDLAAALARGAWPYCSEQHAVRYFRFLAWKRLHTHGSGVRTGA